MKKNYFFPVLLSLICGYLPAQNLILVNGGQYGNPQENVNVQIFDPASSSSRTIDTVHTNSVQEILIDGDFAFVAAQDSIIKYDLSTEKRIAAAAFPGFSTKALALSRDYLLVGNWYGKSSHNLYVYNRNTLALVDSIQEISKGVSSIVVSGGMVQIAQNSSTANFEDTLGYISLVSLSPLAFYKNIHPGNYSADIGQLLAVDTILFAINAASNSILAFNSMDDTMPSIHQLPHDLQVLNSSQHGLFGDTLFLIWDGKLGSFNLNTRQVQDSVIIDTVVTAFAFDSVRRQFYVTQTDFFSYNLGGIYNYVGVKQANLPVGFSPEVAAMHYSTSTSLKKYASMEELGHRIYPNPANEQIAVEFSSVESNVFLRILDIRGKAVVEKSVASLKANINIADLKPGIYIVQIYDGHRLGTSKLIKR